MVIACHMVGLKHVRREAFDLTSLARPVLDWASKHAKTVALVGGVDGVADKAPF